MLEKLLSFIFAIITAGMVFAAYRQGLKDGRAVKGDKPITPLFPSLRRPKTPEPTEDEKLLAWADAYEG